MSDSQCEGVMETAHVRPFDEAQLGLIFGGLIGMLIQYNDVERVRAMVQTYANSAEFWDTAVRDLSLVNALRPTAPMTDDVQ